MSETFDVIVIGLGGFGSASLYSLAKRGARVLGIEQFGLGHDRGSSHGETRIIRRAYFEHPDYVPLLDHTYQLWRELERESSCDLMDLCGLVLSGPADGEAVPGVLLARELHGVNIETLQHTDAAARFPQIRFPKHHTILAEPDAGYLKVDDCVRTHCDQATKHGAVIKVNEPVVSWRAEHGSVVVRTETGSYSAGKLVIAGGAWSGQLLSGVRLELRIVQKSVFWFQMKLSSSWPVFYFEDGPKSFYGLPGLDGSTIKIAEHSGGEVIKDPRLASREGRLAELDAVRRFASSSLSNLEAEPIRQGRCIYTLSPDGHFVVDRHPQHTNVFLAAGFSGHGFKFTPVIGNAIADLALSGSTDLPIGFLAQSRPGIRDI